MTTVASPVVAALAALHNFCQHRTETNLIALNRHIELLISTHPGAAHSINHLTRQVITKGEM